MRDGTLPSTDRQKTRAYRATGSLEPSLAKKTRQDVAWPDAHAVGCWLAAALTPLLAACAAPAAARCALPMLLLARPIRAA